MDINEVKALTQPISDGIAEMQLSAAEQKAAQEKIAADFEASQNAFKEWQATKDERDQKNQKALDDLLKKANSISLNGGSDASFASQLKVALAENHDSIRGIRKGRSHAFEVKAATMLESTHLTGTGAQRSYLEPAIKPGLGGYNFRDLATVVSTQTGWITLPRESASTGSISRVPENTTKPQIDYTINMVDFKADYIAGYVRISKQMLQDLPFLQTWLPRMLIRDFYKAENTQFYGDLAATATGSTTAPATVYFEKILQWMATLGAAGYVPNGAAGTYANWTAMLTTNGAGVYSLPPVVSVGADGAVRIVGVPYYPVNWVPTGKTIVGDWTYATIAVCDPLKVEFFEQDQDNVIKNLITVRVEAREVLVVEQTDAFIVA